MTAAHVNLDLGVWVFEEHKTVKKTGKPRVIYLGPEMVEMSQRLVAERPDGPLFPSRKFNRPFGKNAIRCRFRNLRKKLPHLKGIVAYAYRYSYASAALENGVGIAQVAELIGHTDTRMVSRHYAHLSQKVEHMKDAARKATGGQWTDAGVTPALKFAVHLPGETATAHDTREEAGKAVGGRVLRRPTRSCGSPALGLR